jgi:glycosyltransferase involved in cell wall biosynthesis
MATLVVAQTNDIANWLKINIKLRKTAVIPNPIIFPLPINDPINDPNNYVSYKRHLLLATGRLVNQKGFDLLLSAFAILEKQFSDWDLVILGEGEMRGALEDKIVKGNLKRRVFMPGRVGNISDWYTKADIYVMSSRYEGFPNTLAEAMAYGCPVISFDCKTGPKDLIKDNIDGILVSKVGDVASLAEAIKYLMLNESVRKEFSERAIVVRETFSIEVITQKWENIFRAYF